MHLTPSTLNHKPYTVHPTPYTLNHRPQSLNPAPYNLLPTPYTIHLTPYTLNHRLRWTRWTLRARTAPLAPWPRCYIYRCK
jgi:hypothetical protein